VNGSQLLLTIVYSLLVVVSGVIAALVIRSTRARAAAAAEPDHERLAGLENRWGVAVVVMLCALLFLTIFSVPYGRTDAPPGAQTVLVRGQQFGWNVQPAQVPAGRPVLFRVSSKDVQHGFGVYDGTKLLFQVQVPAAGEPEQRYSYTFDKPGTYEILCLEFCGVQHHNMRGQLRVT
jgi:cytochrome c oxidase subunit 2